MPSIGMLLCKDHSNDPPTTVASALLLPAKAPSTSKDPQATASDPASSDDGPPPSKSRRQTSSAINAARRDDTPLKSEHVSMPRKQAKRLYTKASSTSSENNGTALSPKKGAPFEDLRNDPAFQTTTSTLPKRASTKALMPDSSVSASDEMGEESTSSSDFGPDAERGSEDEPFVGEFSILDDDNLDVHGPFSNTGESSSYGGERLSDSVCGTVEASATSVADTSHKLSIFTAAALIAAQRHPSERQLESLPQAQMARLPDAPTPNIRRKNAKHRPQFWSQLIAEVKPHASLYNRDHPDYRKITKNSTLWVGVATNMGLKVEVAKSKWQNLRDRLAKEHTRFGNRSDWEHYNEASFLIPFIDFREENRRADENTNHRASASAVTSSRNARIDQITKTRLATEIKRYPSLYDRNHRDYRKAKTNSTRWDSVAKQTGLEVAKARSTWNDLRNRLAVEHATFGNQSNWVHYNETVFLIPFIDYKKRNSGSRVSAAANLPTLCKRPTRNDDSKTVNFLAPMTVCADNEDSAPMLVGAEDGDGNDQMLQQHARSTLTAARAQNTEASDAASRNESSTADSEFSPNNKHVSVDDAGIENHADSVPRDTLVNSDSVQVDSAQVTVFGCLPPSIPCIGELPPLRHFHDLSDSERQEFLKAEEIATQCNFCDPTNESTSGAPDHDQHFYDDGHFYACTRHGCTTRYSNVDMLYNHYALAHDPTLRSLRKCDKCNYVATSKSNLESHVKQPHPKTESEAMKCRTKNCHGNWSMWNEPWYCADCGIWYPEFQLQSHKEHHAVSDLTFAVARHERGARIEGLRDATCPLDGCDQPYTDFIGWYLHCVSKHSEFIPSNGGCVPVPLESDDRARMPMFRCTTCSTSVPIGQVLRHSARCAATLFTETLGPLMRFRAAASGDEPGILRLEYGLNVLQERRLMGFLAEITDHVSDTRRFERTLAAIRRDPFLRSFVNRNRNAPHNSAVYTVAKIRRGIVPTYGEWMKDLTLYVGSTGSISKRVKDHIKNSISNWHEMGLTLEQNEDLYLIRMRIVIDEENSVASFNEHDRQRLEQILIDSLGIGSLYNVIPVRTYGTLLNDTTYRNHLAPRLNQLALILFESTHTQLAKNGTFFAPDDRNVWKLPITRKELKRIVKKTPNADLQDPLVQDTEPPARVEQACSPISAPRLFSPEVYDSLVQLQDTRGYTDEQMFKRFRAWRASKGTVRHAERLKLDEPLMPAGGSSQSGLFEQRLDISPDLFADLYPKEAEAQSYHDANYSDVDNVQSTSNGPDYRALKWLRASMTRPSASSHAEGPKPDESHMPAGESMQSRLPRCPSPDPSVSLLRSEFSAHKPKPTKEASDSVPPSATGLGIARIPSYGRRCTQYVDLDREPVDLTDDSSSEASLDEPSPTESGVDIRSDCGNVLGASYEQADPTAEDRDVGNAAKKSAKKAQVATASDHNEEAKDSDSDTYDKCAYKNCRRPQHENINWIQCDDCNEWYHSLCVTGREKAVEEDEFHCGCAKTGKRRPGQAHHESGRPSERAFDDGLWSPRSSHVQHQ